jgi:drug/metabolite transporter (DMT)-like permease
MPQGFESKMVASGHSASSDLAAGDRAARSRRIAGILILCVGAFVFSIQDTLVKWISGSYPISQLLAIRSLIGFVPLLIFTHYDGGLRSIRTRRLGALLLRSLMLFLAYGAYYLAISAVPLAEAVSLYYSTPLFIVALSGPLLQERIGLGRWLSVCFGLIGVIVICKPGAGVFDPAALLAVVSAIFYAAAQVMARMIGPTESASVMSLYQNAVNCAGALLLGLLVGSGLYGEADHHPAAQFLLRAWTMPNLVDLLIMLSTGIIAAIGSWCLAHAYRTTEATVVAPFEYTAIVWAVLWGFVFWGEVPGLNTLIGVAMIVVAGFYVLRAARH